MIAKVLADAVMSRLLLVILILMIGTVVGVLLVKSPGGDAGNGRVERSLSAP
jgi:preprotein translocase subunit SecG